MENDNVVVKKGSKSRYFVPFSNFLASQGFNLKDDSKESYLQNIILLILVACGRPGSKLTI